MRCQKCNQESPEGGNFCIRCGFPLQKSMPPAVENRAKSPENSGPSSSPSKIWKRVAIIIISILVLASIGGWIYYDISIKKSIEKRRHDSILSIEEEREWNLQMQEDSIKARKDAELAEYEGKAADYNAMANALRVVPKEEKNHYLLKDINGDGRPELFISVGKWPQYAYLVYTVKDGIVTQLGKIEIGEGTLYSGDRCVYLYYGDGQSCYEYKITTEGLSINETLLGEGTYNIDDYQSSYFHHSGTSMIEYNVSDIQPLRTAFGLD